jgi:adhesin HecA-like repeat protein
VELRGTIGPLPSLLAGRDLRVDLSARQPGGNVSVKGTLARFDDLQGSELAVEASGDSLSSLGPLFRIDLPWTRPFEAAARLEGSEHQMDIRDLKASSGDSDIEGDLHIQLGNRTRVAATLTSRYLDLTPYLPERTAGQARLKKPGPEPLPFDALRLLDGALALKVGRVRIGDFGLEDCILDATLDSGHLRVSASAGHDRLAADVDLRPEQTHWRVDLRHKGRLDLAWLIRDEKAGPASKVPAALDVRLSGAGDSLQTMLGSADGHVEVVLGGGRLSRKAAALPLGGLLVTLLDTINPANLARAFDNLECAVLQFEIANGIATSTRGLAVQTESVNAIGGGAVNLRSQELDLHFKTVQRKGLGINLLGIAGGSISITGTLEDPKVSIDPQGLILRAGVAWATGGVSLLAGDLVNRLTASGDPCDAVLREDDGQDK